MEEEMPATQIMDDTQILESSADSEPPSENAQIGVLVVDGQNYPVYTGDNVIGRAPSCQIVLGYSAVSSKHAVIEANTKICTIHDLDSSNKTKKGGNVLRPHIRFELKDGDELLFGDIMASFTTKVDLDLSESLFDESDYGTPVGPTTVRAPFRTPAPPDRFGTPNDFVPETPCGAGPLKAAFNTSELNFVPASQSSPLPARDVVKIPESPGDCLDDSSFICASQAPAPVRPLRPQTASQFTITKIEEPQAAVVSSVPDSDDEDVDLTLAPDAPRDNVEGILEVETQAVNEMPHSDVFDAETQPVATNDMFAAETEAVYRSPQAVYSASETDDLLAAATQAVPHEEVEADDMFGMCTQAVVEPERERGRGVSESDLMEAETQAVVHNDNIMSDSELFGAATQAPTNDSELMGAPLQIPGRSFKESMSDSQLMGAPTQAMASNKRSFNDMSNDSEMFQNSENSEIDKAIASSSMSDSLLMGAPTQAIVANKMNDSEMFGAATQAIASSSMSDSLLMGAPTQAIVSNKMNDSEMFGAATQAIAPKSMTDSLLFGASTQAIANPSTDDDLMGASTQMVAANVTTDSVFEAETQAVEPVKTNEHIFTDATQAVGPAKDDEDDDLFMGATQAVVSEKSDADFLAAETQAVHQNVEADDLDTSNCSEILDSNIEENEAFEPNEADNDSQILDSNTALEPEKEKNPIVNDEQNHDLEPEKGKFESNDLDTSNDSIILDSNTDLEPEKVNGDVTRGEPDKEVIFQSETDKNESVHEEQIADTQAMEPLEEDDDDDFIGATQAPAEFTPAVETNQDFEVEGETQVPVHVNSHDLKATDNLSDISEDSAEPVLDKKDDDNLSDISDDLLMENGDVGNVDDITNSEVAATNCEVAEEPSAPVTTEVDDDLDDTTEAVAVADADDSVVLSSQMPEQSRLSKTNYESVTMMKDDSVIASSQPPQAPQKLSNTTYGTINMDQTEVVDSPIISAKEGEEGDKLIDAKDTTVTEKRVSNVSPAFAKVLEEPEMGSPIFISKKNKSMSQSMMSQSRLEESARKSILEETAVHEDLEDSFASNISNVSVTRRSKPTNGFKIDTSVTLETEKESESVTPEVFEHVEETEKDASEEPPSEPDSMPLLPMTQALIGGDDVEVESSASEDEDNEPNALFIVEKDVVKQVVTPVPALKKTPKTPAAKTPKTSAAKTPKTPVAKTPKTPPKPSSVKSKISPLPSPVNSQNSSFSEDSQDDMGRGRRQRKPTAVMELSMEQEKEEEEEKAAKSPTKRRISKVTSLIKAVEKEVQDEEEENAAKSPKKKIVSKVSPSKSESPKKVLIKAVEKEVVDDEAATQPWLGTDVPEDSEELLADTQPLVIEEVKAKRVRKSTAKMLELEASQTPVAQASKTKTPITVKEAKTKTPVVVKETKTKTPVVVKQTKTKTPVVVKKTPVAVISSDADTQPWVGTESQEAEANLSKSGRVRKATPKMLEMEAAKTQATSKTPAASGKNAIAPKRLVLASRTSIGATKSPVVAVRTPVIVSNSSINNSTFASPVLNKSAIANTSSTTPAVAGIKPMLENKPQEKAANKRRSSLIVTEKEGESPTKRVKADTTPKEVETPAQRRGASKKLPLPASLLIEESEPVVSKPKGRGRISELKPAEIEESIPATPAQRRGKGKKLTMPNSLLINTPEASLAVDSAIPSPVSLPTPAVEPTEEPGRGRRGRASKAADEPKAAPATKGRKGRQSAPVQAPEAAPAPKGRRGRQSTQVEIPEPSIEEVEEPAPAPKGRRGRTSVVPEQKVAQPVKRGRKAAVVETVEPEKEKVEAEPVTKGRRGKQQVEPEEESQPDLEPSSRGRKGRPSKAPEPKKEPEPVKASSRRGRGKASQPVEETKQTIVKGGKNNQKTESQPDTAAADTSANEFIVEEKKGRSRGGKRKQEEEAPTAAKKTKTERKPASEIESPVPPPAIRRLSQDSETLNARSVSPSLRRGSSASRGSGRHQVMFTGYNDKKDNDLVVELGGVLTDVCSECSVLVTDQIKRTEKLLCAVAKGVPVVSPSWLQESKKSGSFLDPWQFVINDTDREKQWEFSLVKTLQSAKKQPLLKGLKIHVTPKVKPPPELFQQVIQAGGGEYLKSLPKNSEEGLLVISCPENKASHAKLKKAGIPIMDKEFILTGLLQFKLDYQLVL